jgi:lipopolysaccharide export LptBFGC system permease protein LptF
MAESRRKSTSKTAVKPADDPTQTRLERLTLALYLEGGVAIVVGMIVLSEFLSNGSVDKPVWIAATILGSILALGIGYTVLARRKTQASA